ncbi:phage holin family protein [Lysobacter korlensis]|uniref:Phage holin family protein n=1 Tax=Lysobacter korlensis TaxID=553636 RepID=A0ABV6RMM6_9GAMM
MNMRSDYRPNETPRNGNGNGNNFAFDDNREIGVTAGSTSSQDASIGTLLRELAHEVPALLTKEVALAKSEMRENLRETKEGVAAVATGGAVALAGLVVLLMAVVYALSNVMAPWLAALLVGAGALLIGYAMVSAGKKKFDSESLKPERTVDSLRKDKNAIRGGTQ